MAKQQPGLASCLGKVGELNSRGVCTPALEPLLRSYDLPNVGLTQPEAHRLRHLHPITGTLRSEEHSQDDLRSPNTQWDQPGRLFSVRQGGPS